MPSLFVKRAPDEAKRAGSVRRFESERAGVIKLRAVQESGDKAKEIKGARAAPSLEVLILRATLDASAASGDQHADLRIFLLTTEAVGITDALVEFEQQLLLASREHQ